MSKKNTKQIDEILSESEEEEVIVTKANNKTKAQKNKKQIQKDEEEAEDSTLLNKKQARKKSISNSNSNSNKKKKVEKKEELSDDHSDEEEEVKPKKKVKQAKKELLNNNVDNDEEEENIKPKKKAESKKKNVQEDEKAEDDQEESEPKLVKKEVEEETPKQMQKKTFSPGTWKELFIKNLSYNTTQEGLAEFFQKYGDIEETKIVYDKITHRSKGVGFCRFYDSESAARAMEDAGTMTLDGRPIAISLSIDKPAISKAKIAEFKSDSNFQGERFGVFIGNLSFKSNEKGIENFFKDCGKIIDIRIAKTPEGKIRGFAHVDLDSKESVDKALKKSGMELDGREIRIDRSEQKPKTESSNYNKRNAFSGQKGNRPDPISKAKKSGAIIETESKSKPLSDSEDGE